MRRPYTLLRQNFLKKLFLFFVLCFLGVLLYKTHQRHKTVIIIGHGSSARLSYLFTLHRKLQLEILNHTDEELDVLSRKYHRDVKLWALEPHGLLPATKPVSHESCLRQYLPTSYSGSGVSIVITFKDELMILLYRCLTSISVYTPHEWLKEVILIDDGSETNRQTEVEEFSERMNLPLRYIRHEESSGIANRRKEGIESSKGDIAVMLDSHMEVSFLWLHPVISLLKSKPNGIFVPQVHMILEAEYSKFSMNSNVAYGLHMHAGYQMLQFYDVGPPDNDPSAFFAVASLGGGALAGYRSTLLHYYPESAQLEQSSWGVENNRIALRIWNCGDGLWSSTCSMVLHTNGPDVVLSRYSQDRPNFFSNLQSECLAEIGMFFAKDQEGVHEWRRFCESAGVAADSLEMVQVMQERIKGSFDYASCSHDYQWYLKNVHKHFSYLHYDGPYFTKVGELQSVYDPRFCVQRSQNKLATEMWCRGENVFFHDNHLLAFAVNEAVHVQYNQCLDAPSTESGADIITYGCHSPAGVMAKPGNTQRFSFSEGEMRHLETDRCLTYKAPYVVTLDSCNGDVTQKWKFSEAKWRKREL